MKCSRCAAEVPGQAQFCMRCGTPVNVGRPGGPTVAAQPAAIAYSSRPSSKSKLPAILAALALLCAIGVIVALKMRPNSKVTEAVASPSNTGALTDINTRVAPTGPLTDKKDTIQPGPPDPVDIIDYLKHVKEIERQRVALLKKQVGVALTLSPTSVAENLKGFMNFENEQESDRQIRQNYEGMQKKMNDLSAEWGQLSTAFNSYPKPVPSACVALRDKYLDLLGKTDKLMSSISAAFARAMSGDASGGLDALSGLQGNDEVEKSADSAEQESTSIHAKYNITKDWEIKAEGGKSNPFGVGR